ncbi:MAG: crotonobetainyl-CoA--carnitine CoA-transferase, partial [Nanoarchaeota archaeon]|nr:crotonobetainyl-CoA--carnitine CoA-transferase [Nanoarchaeota archaeon]
MKKNQVNLISSKEKKNRKKLNLLFNNCPINEDEKLNNLGLFIKRQLLSRILFMHMLYKKIIDIHGVVIEFGVRWGQNLALLQNFRGIYEPFNYNRKILGFDTFEGFPSVSDKDKNFKKGDYGVTKEYEKYLQKIL